MDLGLDRKVALVTGASQGIGRAIVERLAAEGCTVVAVARGAASLDSAIAAMTANDGRVIAQPGDAGDTERIREIIGDTVRDFGAVHILVNNAAAFRYAAFDEIDEAQWLATCRTNLLGPVFAAQAVLPHMRAQGWGRIINISSAAGSQPGAEHGDYSATKAALNNATKMLSKVAGHPGITVNAIAPGLVRTPLFDGEVRKQAQAGERSFEDTERDFVRALRPANERGGPGEPFEVAALVAFLASALAGYITGSLFRIDGGATHAV